MVTDISTSCAELDPEGEFRTGSLFKPVNQFSIQGRLCIEVFLFKNPLNLSVWV